MTYPSPLTPLTNMNHWYYYDLQGNKKGPVDWNTLRQLAKNRKIFPNTQVVTPDGKTKSALKVDGLDFSTVSTPPNAQPKTSVNDILESFRTTDFKKEILPVNAHNAVVILKDPTFWVVLMLGALPLAIMSFDDLSVQLYGLFFFFALVWGGILRGLVLRSTDSLVLPIIAFFVTGIGGIFLLLTFYQCLPAFYMGMAEHSDLIIQLFGFIFQVGLWEELCKIVPVILYLAWKRKNAEPMMMLLIGVFSGLGFAAFENIHYATGGIGIGLQNVDEMVRNMLSAESEEEFHQAVAVGGLGTILHSHSIMTMALLRAVSLVFAHSIWTGIFAYYLACAMRTRKQWAVFCCLGLVVPMFLHGIYDWLCSLQPGYTTLVVGISFFLFYVYLAKLRRQIE